MTTPATPAPGAADHAARVFPQVTCLCLTRARRNWLPQAIRSWERQEYVPRELLIVADSQEDVAGLVPDYTGLVRVIFTGPQPVGAKRNIGCEDAAGDLIAIWDDDDYSAPGRLADQVARLAQTGRAVTGYRAMKFTDGRRWWVYNGPPRFALATSLCFTREWWRKHRFEEIQCGQDEAFAAAAAGAGQLADAPDLDLMYASVHNGNTSPRAVDVATAGWTPLKGDAHKRLEPLCALWGKVWPAA